MRKLQFLASVLAIAVCFAGCNNETEELQTLSKNEVTAIENVKSEITALNANYKSNLNPQTRMRKWLRWLIFGAADAAGAIFGGLEGACGASTLAWTVTKDEVASKQQTVQTEPASAIKPNNLSKVAVGSIGYVHNTVISNTFQKNKDIYSKNSKDVLNLVFEELSSHTAVVLSKSQKADIVRKTNIIVKTFNINKSIEEYYNELITLTTDPKQKEALKVCSMVLDGLQYVDGNDITYINNVKTIINKSALNPVMKTILLNGISVADASAKLWNTNDIADVKL